MHIKRVTIANIRSIGEVVWDRGNRKGSGWHVVLGDNGSGKSSFLRAISLALVGPKDAFAARQDWSSWLRRNNLQGTAEVEIDVDPNFDAFQGKGRVGQISTVSCSVSIQKNESRIAEVLYPEPDAKYKPSRHVWGSPTGYGWFSAAYGPFRRFSGGDKDAQKIFYSNPRLGAHLSVFGESIALSESLEWLRELNYRRLEKDTNAEKTLAFLRSFVNQDGFLPHNVKLTDVSSKGVEFEDASGLPVPVEELSDGYRSILSMAFELIRQLARVFGAEKIFDEQRLRVIASGVVLIDEVDAHLHPTWQKQIGFWLTEHFPNIQFIVTTHSPLVCHAAVKGSIFRLPTPGDPESRGYMAKGLELDRLLYGDILAAYSTEAFGTPETKSPESREMRKRLAALNTKEVMKGLNPAEKTEQQRLRAILPIEPQFAAKE